VQHRVDFGSTFGAISAIPTTVSSSVPGTSYFSSGMRLIGGCCAAKKQAWKRRQR
jgi:S-methylmethionine-dependent homocysteine/selenocysteine methylase